MYIDIIFVPRNLDFQIENRIEELVAKIPSLKNMAEVEECQKEINTMICKALDLTDDEILAIGDLV